MLGQVLEPLITLLGLQIPDPPLSLEQSEARTFQAQAIFAALRQLTHANVAVIGAQRVAHIPRKYATHSCQSNDLNFLARSQP